MKRNIVALLSLLLIMIGCLLLTSCSESESSVESDEDDFSEETPPVSSADTINLNVYNWGEYMSLGKGDSLDVNDLFEKYYYEKYNVKVNVVYSTYATNEDMYSKIKSNAGSYDVIFPSDYMIERMIAEDMLLPFDANTLENFENISENFKGDNCPYDVGNLYSVPYNYGMICIIYNNNEVDEEDVADTSWDLMWNEKYKGKILQFNNPRDAFGTAMYKDKIDVNTENKDDWDRACDLLKEQKPLLQAYVSDEIFDKITGQSAFIAPYYAGDFITMYSDVEEGIEKGLFEDNFLSYYYPKEGTNYFVDAMCIPKNSKNPEIAKEYINFMLTEEVAVANALTVGYASPNNLVVNSEEYREEMGDFAIDVLYNTDFSNVSMYKNLNDLTLSVDGEQTSVQNYLNTLWEDVKTWIAVEPWVHVVSIAIIAAVIGACIYSFYIKKKRSRFYRYRDRAAKSNKTT